MSRIFYPDCRVEVAAWGECEAFICDDAEVWIELDTSPRRTLRQLTNSEWNQDG